MTSNEPSIEGVKQGCHFSALLFPDLLRLCTRRMMLFGQFMSKVSKASDFLFKIDKSIKAVIQYLHNLECQAPTTCKRIYHECEGRKICPEDRLLSTRGLPSDDKR